MQEKDLKKDESERRSEMNNLTLLKNLLEQSFTKAKQTIREINEELTRPLTAQEIQERDEENI